MLYVISYFPFYFLASSEIESTSISNESCNLVYLLLMSTAKPVLPPLYSYHTKILTVSINESFLFTTNNIATSMIITITITITTSSSFFSQSYPCLSLLTCYCLFSYFFGCCLLLLTLFCCHHCHQSSRSFVRFIRFVRFVWSFVHIIRLYHLFVLYTSHFVYLFC